MSTSNTLIIDGDGVAINFSAGYAAYMKAEHNLTPLVVEPAHFNYTDAYPMLEKPWAHIPAFIQSEFFRDTPFYPEAVSALKQIHAQGTRILMVTSCGDDPSIQKARLACINNHVGRVIDDVIFLPLGGGKQETLATLPAATFVDDQLAMCIDGALAGHQSFLFDRRYNRTVEHVDMKPHNIHRALSWHCLPHIGHDNAPRNPSERMALQLLIEQNYRNVEHLSDTQQRAFFKNTLAEHGIRLSEREIDSIYRYAENPYSQAFVRDSLPEPTPAPVADTTSGQFSPATPRRTR